MRDKNTKKEIALLINLIDQYVMQLGRLLSHEQEVPELSQISDLLGVLFDRHVNEDGHRKDQ